jgi:ricin-type beta-trefoil lectin protein
MPTTTACLIFRNFPRLKGNTMHVTLRPLVALTATILLVVGGLALAVPAQASVTSGGAIVNAGSGLCLGIQGSSRSSGAFAEQGYCTPGSDTQTWSIRAQLVDAYGDVADQFENGAHMCLGVQGGSTSSGAQVLQGTCSGTSDHSQFWLVLPDGNGHYILDNYKSYLCRAPAALPPPRPNAGFNRCPPAPSNRPVAPSSPGLVRFDWGSGDGSAQAGHRRGRGRTQ